MEMSEEQLFAHILWRDTNGIAGRYISDELDNDVVIVEECELVEVEGVQIYSSIYKRLSNTKCYLSTSAWYGGRVAYRRVHEILKEKQ